MAGFSISGQTITAIGLFLDLVGAILLAPVIIPKAKRANDVYKWFRTEDAEYSSLQIHSYLHDFEAEPERLGTPEEEFKEFLREWFPPALGITLLVIGYLLQLIAILF